MPKWCLNEEENADNGFPHLSLWVLRAVSIHTCALVHAAVPLQKWQLLFLCFKGLINYTWGKEEGGQREISKDQAFRFSKLSSLESVMTQLENALSSPHYWSHKNGHHYFANSWSFPGLCHQPIKLPISVLCVCVCVCVSVRGRECEWASTQYICLFVNHLALFHLFLLHPYRTALFQ